MDWTDKTREDRFLFEMVDPFNLDVTRGELDNVVTGSGSLTFGYDTDTKVSGTLKAVNSNYIHGSLIRIHHAVDEYGYRNELGTFFVSDINNSSLYAQEKTFTLVSMLARISEDLLVSNYVIGAGSTMLNALKTLLTKYSVAYSVLPGCGDKKVTKAIVYEVGENVLDVAIELAEACRCRLDVNGHGVVTITPENVAFSSMTSVFEFNDHNGTVTGPIEISDNPFSATTRVIVTSEKTEKQTYKETYTVKVKKNGKTVTEKRTREKTKSVKKTTNGFADIAASHSLSYNNLGRRKTEIYNEKEISPFNGSQAANVAKGILNTLEKDPTQYSFQGIYTEYIPGTVITVGENNRYHKAVILNKSFNLDPGMVTSYTCEGV